MGYYGLLYGKPNTAYLDDLEMKKILLIFANSRVESAHSLSDLSPDIQKCSVTWIIPLGTK